MNRKKTEAPVEIVEVYFRMDRQLLDILDGWAVRTDRSRDLALNALLEFALTEEGLWPPPRPRKSRPAS